MNRLAVKEDNVGSRRMLGERVGVQSHWLQFHPNQYYPMKLGLPFKESR